jgi:hypothetical protein
VTRLAVFAKQYAIGNFEFSSSLVAVLSVLPSHVAATISKLIGQVNTFASGFKS